VYKISSKSDDFLLRYGDTQYNDFQNGGRPPFWILEIFIFDHVMFTKFKICCCVQNFVKIGLF